MPVSYIVRTTTSDRPVGAESLYHAVLAFEDTISAISRAWSTRRTRKALYALSDEQLEDIGLTRGQIADYASL
jgi:uncharacterized protein YjiS (DUF1127 family)